MTPMTPSLEDYLECIYLFSIEDKPARVRDIAHELMVKTPSVVNAVAQLVENGLATHKPYADIELTVAGRVLAQEVLERHKLLTQFLASIGVPAEFAEADACKMEHILSPETITAVRAFMKKKGTKAAAAPKRPHTRR